MGEYIGHQIARVETAVRRLLGPNRSRPKTLHDLHRDLRRLRVWVAWAGTAAPSGPPMEELVLRLRRLTRLVGRVRDLDVELALWHRYRPDPSPAGPGSRRALATFGRRLQDDSRTGRELLRATLLAEVHAGFFERIRLALRSVDSPSSVRDLKRSIARERERLAHRAARKRRRALREPAPDTLHEFRVLIRRLRYLSDLEDRLDGRTGASFPPRYARLLRRLGELHDRDVLAAHLDAADPAHRKEAWSRQFQADHRQLRKDLLDEMKDLRPRRHLDRRSARQR